MHNCDSARKVDSTSKVGSFLYAFFFVCDKAVHDCFLLCLSHFAVNFIGDEGASILAEPLGKLTLLQNLDLGSAIAAVLLDWGWCCV